MARRSGCLAVVLSSILVLMAVGSGWWFLSNLVRVIDHEPVAAVVVDLVASTGSDGDTVFAPVYEYEVAGRSYRYTSQVSLGGIVVPDIGDTKTLLYNPDNPNDARVRNWVLLLVLPGILVLLPILILAAMGWLMVRRRSRDDASEPAADELPHPAWSQEPDPPLVPIEAVFMGAEPSQMDPDGKVRYRVMASAEIDEVMHEFVGAWLEEDPTLLLMERGNRVEVLIDPDHPATYEVVVPSPE